MANTLSPSDPTRTERKVPTRRISFEESFKDVPKHFADDGDLILSHIAASLSSVFPDGEDYFVRAVKRARDHVTDAALRADVEGFLGQEDMHGREHAPDVGLDPHLVLYHRGSRCHGTSLCPALLACDPVQAFASACA